MAMLLKTENKIVLRADEYRGLLRARQLELRPSTSRTEVAGRYVLSREQYQDLLWSLRAGAFCRELAHE